MDFIPYKSNETLEHKYYQIPQELFVNEKYKNKLNSDSKILYAFLLDRLSLSQKNHWIDEDNNVYLIFTREEVQEKLNLSDKTVTKSFKILMEVNLVQEKRQGLGEPNLIYVGKINHSDSENLRFLTRKNYDSGLGDVPGLGSEKLRCNNTENNKTEFIDTNLISSKDEKGRDERSQYRQYFMEELAIDIMKERYPYDKDVIDEILELILDTVCSTRKTIGIAGEQRPIDIVKSRFMKLDSGHLEFVLQSMSDNTTLIRNMKQYLLAALYNAPLTMNNYYKSLVKHDMASRII